MSESESIRRITFELPSGITLSDEQLADLIPQFKSQLIDTKSEKTMVRVQTAPREVPRVVRSQEAPVPQVRKQAG